MLDVLLLVLIIATLMSFVILSIIAMYEIIMMSIDDLKFWAKLRRIKEKNGK